MKITRSAGIYKALGAEFFSKMKTGEGIRKLIKSFEQTSVNISSNVGKPLRGEISPKINSLRQFFESKPTPELLPLRVRTQNVNKSVVPRSAPITNNLVNPFRAALMTGVFGLQYQRSISADNNKTWIKPKLTSEELEKSIVHKNPRPQYKIYGETILKVDFNKSNPAERIKTYGQEFLFTRTGDVAEKVKKFSTLDIPLTVGVKK